MSSTAPQPIACHECGMIQTVPFLAKRQRAVCAQCGMPVLDPEKARYGNRLSAAAAVSALILYIPAISLPILTIERMGYRSHNSVWKGVVEFLSGGDYFVGMVVLICSVVIPLLKLLGLLSLVWGANQMPAKRKAKWFRLIEWSGKWGMLDVLLIAVLVAWVKMGDLVTIRPGKAVIAFCLMVLLSLIASACFDPRAIWTRHTPQNQ